MRDDELIRSYLDAKAAVVVAGFGSEIDWQEQLDLASTNESDFLREYAWVVLSTGMSERVVQEKFPAISAAFLNWQCAAAISQRAKNCYRRALHAFNHPGKIAAIVTTSRWIAESGFNAVRLRLEKEGLDYLRGLPFIGPATVFHLAKNLGLHVAKPDRHLTRIAAACGYDDVQSLCKVISCYVGDTVDVVDIVLWRYALISPGYLSRFRGTA